MTHENISFPPWGSSGRFFGVGEVRLAILAMLAEKPKNGYELMKELREKSRGTYKMSAGTVYPSLQQLENEGLIVPAPRDRKKLFEITDLGRKALDRQRPAIDGIWKRASNWGDWTEWMGPEAVVVSTPVAELLKATSRAVKRSGGHPARTSEIYEILNRATQDLEELWA
jgi:DNA-binding PadR family transcriptional regulator